MRDPDALYRYLLKVRRRMRITQREFAGRFGIPVATLRRWERGNRRPNGTALTLLVVIRNNPRAVLDAVRQTRFLFPGVLPPVLPPRSIRTPPGFGVPRLPMRPWRKRPRDANFHTA